FSLVLWLPTMRQALSGGVGLPAAGLRYLAALGFSRLTIGVIDRMVTSYHLSALRAAAAAEEESANAPRATDDVAAPRRRSDDHPVICRAREALEDPRRRRRRPLPGGRGPGRPGRRGDDHGAVGGGRRERAQRRDRR